MLNHDTISSCGSQSPASISNDIERLQGKIEAAMNLEEAIKGIADKFGNYVLNDMELHRSYTSVKFGLPNMKKELANLYGQLEIAEKVAMVQKYTAPHDEQYEAVLGKDEPTT